MSIKNNIKKIASLLNRHAIWAILIVASFLRFRGLTSRDLWYDEAFTGIAVKEEFWKMIEMISRDIHPPFYYASLKAFSSFFDYNVFGLRLFSAIFGVAVVYVIYILSKEIFNEKVGKYSAIIATISPLAVQYSQEARMYMMLVCFFLLATFFFAKGLKTNKIKYYCYWGIFIGLSILTHYISIIFAPLYLLAFVIWNYNAIEKENLIYKIKSLLKIVFDKKIIAGYLMAFVVFLPWLKMFIYHLSAKGDNLSWVVPATLSDITEALEMFLFGTPLGELSFGMPNPNQLQGIEHNSIQILIAFLLGIGLLKLFQIENKKKLSLILLFSFGFLFLIYLLSVFTKGQQFFIVRYLMIGGFFFYILIALWLSKYHLKIAIFVFILYLFLISLIVRQPNSQGFNEMSLYLKKYEKNNFYILNSFDYVVAKYYLGEKRLYLYNYDWPQYNPDYWAAIGKGLKRTENFKDLRNDPAALIISNKPLSSNQYFSIEDLVLVEKYENIFLYKFNR